MLCVNIATTLCECCGKITLYHCCGNIVTTFKQCCVNIVAMSLPNIGDQHWDNIQATWAPKIGDRCCVKVQARFVNIVAMSLPNIGNQHWDNAQAMLLQRHSPMLVTDIVWTLWQHGKIVGVNLWPLICLSQCPWFPSTTHARSSGYHLEYFLCCNCLFGLSFACYVMPLLYN